MTDLKKVDKSLKNLSLVEFISVLDLESSDTDSTVSTASTASSTRSHSEFPSLSYCKKHPTSAIRYYCHICKVALCDKCWLTEHDEDDNRKQHDVGHIKVNIQPQKEIQTRIVENRKDCQQFAQNLEKSWKAIVGQAQEAVKMQNDVLKATTANQLEQKSSKVRSLIQNHITDVRKFKENILNELEELERQQRGIFGDAVDYDIDRLSICSSSTLDGGDFSRGESPVSEGSSEGAVGGVNDGQDGPVQVNEKVASKRGQKRELVRVTQSAIGDEKFGSILRAVYISATKEMIIFTFSGEITVFSPSVPNGKFEKKKKMQLKESNKEYLSDIALDSNNCLYGVIKNRKRQISRVALLDITDNEMIKDRNELLDTEGLLNEQRVYCGLCSVGEIVAVVVYDGRKEEPEEWEFSSVTLYRSLIRQQTVLLNIRTNVQCIFTRVAFVNENTLLLNCDWDETKLAVVSLPQQQTTANTELRATTSAQSSTSTSNSSHQLRPKSIKYIDLYGVHQLCSLVWLPSEECVSPETADGFLFASNVRYSLVYKMNFEKDMSEVAEGEKKRIDPIEEIGSVYDTVIWCSIDSSTLFASTKLIEGKPKLLHLEYKTH